MRNVQLYIYIYIHISYDNPMSSSKSAKNIDFCRVFLVASVFSAARVLWKNQLVMQGRGDQAPLQHGDLVMDLRFHSKL